MVDLSAFSLSNKLASGKGVGEWRVLRGHGNDCLQKLAGWKFLDSVPRSRQGEEGAWKESRVRTVSLSEESVQWLQACGIVDKLWDILRWFCQISSQKVEFERTEQKIRLDPRGDFVGRSNSLGWLGREQLALADQQSKSGQRCGVISLLPLCFRFGVVPQLG
jgi:hypothetical protein